MVREGFGPLKKFKCKQVISKMNMIWKSNALRACLSYRRSSEVRGTQGNKVRISLVKLDRVQGTPLNGCMCIG